MNSYYTTEHKPEVVDEVKDIQLPTEQRIPTSNRKLILIGVATLIGFIAINLSLHFLLARFPKSFANKYRRIQELIEPADVVILGDSTAGRGILPAIIEQETGLRTVSISTVAEWSYPGDLYLLQWYIEKFGPPSILIIGHKYNINFVNTDPIRLLLDTTVPLHEWDSEYMDLQITLRDIFQDTAIELFPSVFRNLSTQKMIEKYLFEDINATTPKPFGTSVHTDHISDNKRELFINYHKWDLDAHDGSFSQYNQYGIDGLFQIIEDYEIQTYMSITPILREVSELEKFGSYTDYQQEFWSNLAGESSNLHYNPEIIIFDKELMYDTHHVHVDGAIIYTQYLIDWIWRGYDPPSLNEVLSTN